MANKCLCYQKCRYALLFHGHRYRWLDFVSETCGKENGIYTNAKSKYWRIIDLNQSQLLSPYRLFTYLHARLTIHCLVSRSLITFWLPKCQLHVVVRKTLHKSSQLQMSKSFLFEGVGLRDCSADDVPFFGGGRGNQQKSVDEGGSWFFK